MRRRRRGIEGVEDAGVGPHKTCWDAEDRERGGEEGGEWGGNGVRREVKGGGVVGGEGAEEGGGGELREADGKCLTIFCNGVLDGGDGEHVMQRLDWGGAKGAADFAYGDILGDLEDTDDGFRSPVGPDWETIE